MNAKVLTPSPHLTREDSMRIIVFDRLAAAARLYSEAQEAYRRAVMQHWPAIELSPPSVRRSILPLAAVGADCAEAWPADVPALGEALGRLVKAEATMRGLGMARALEGGTLHGDVATLGAGLSSIVRAPLSFRIPSGPRYAFCLAFDPGRESAAFGVLVREGAALDRASALVTRTRSGVVEMLTPLTARVAQQVTRELSELVATLHGELIQRAEESRAVVKELRSA